MALKNYTSGGRNTFEKIQQILSSHGANKIMFDYKKDGTLEAITFGLEIDGQQRGFKLPALVENVTEILYGGTDRWGRAKKITETQREQAYCTAWANIRDWLDAQMALVETKQVKIQQVFLAYMVINKAGQTLSEHFEANPKFLLKDNN